MADKRPIGLLSQATDHMQTEEGQRLLTALTAALQEGGPAAVKRVMTTLLNEEKELREIDGDAGAAHGE